VTRFVGVVHLPALPGSPRSRLSLRECVQLALADAQALEAGGVDAIIVENFNDAPFHADTVEPHTVAAMSVACRAIREAVSCDIGVNVLRNDALAALGIAVACEARFIRVNVLTGAMLTDQGIVTGRAAELLRVRRLLGAERVEVVADVLVKHAVPLGPVTLEDALRDTIERGLADAVIITGTATGAAASPEDLRKALALSSVPVYVGSGVTAANVRDIIPAASGVIVGSSLKVDGVVSNPVDVNRVHELREALDAASA
jgi:uncharacterized protein